MTGGKFIRGRMKETRKGFKIWGCRFVPGYTQMVDCNCCTNPANLESNPSQIPTTIKEKAVGTFSSACSAAIR